jgi:hypothetical protein
MSETMTFADAAYKLLFESGEPRHYRWLAEEGIRPGSSGSGLHFRILEGLRVHERSTQLAIGMCTHPSTSTSNASGSGFHHMVWTIRSTGSPQAYHLVRRENPVQLPPRSGRCGRESWKVATQVIWTVHSVFALWSNEEPRV